MLNPGEALALLRESVPESDYEECKGCHNGSTKCFVVHYLHKNCPCSTCLLKTSCTEYCDKYIGSIINIVKENKDKMVIIAIGKMGYTIQFKLKDGRKLQASKKLKRWLTPKSRLQLLFTNDDY